jgi:uncharacterized membrane protein
MAFFYWLKILHLAAFVIGLGSAVAKYIVIGSQRRSQDLLRVSISEEFALSITKRLESPALLIAWLLGLVLTMLKSGYFSETWLHTKMGVTILMLGLSHMSAASLRKIGKLRAESPSSERIEAAKSRLNIYGVILGLLAFVTFYLVIFQPSW